MSRLRRLAVSDRWSFITWRLLPGRGILSDSEFATLAKVIEERRAEHGFLLTAWVFPPDPAAAGHAIFCPRHPLTISRVMEATKDGARKRINRRRQEGGMLWRPRFFDRALRTVREYNQKVEYIHLNPVRAGWVSRAEERVAHLSLSRESAAFPSDLRFVARPYSRGRRRGATTYEKMPREVAWGWRTAKV
jgi:putative transposase